VIYAASPAGVEERRRAFFRKCRLKCKAIADSFEEAAERLFTFTRLRAVNGKALAPPTRVERLHMEFKRRIKIQTVLPPPRLQRMLFWALLASGQIPVRQVDGWQSLTQKLADKPIDLAA
jgi:transposase-like protein